MCCRILIFDFDDGRIADPIDPANLASSDKLWERDVNAYAPWRPVDNQGEGGVPGVRVWRSGRGGGDLSVIICGRCASSMDIAWKLIGQGVLKSWDSVLALEQTSGRGQYKRNWISPAGNIYAAWHWPDLDMAGEVAMEWQGLLSLVAGYILAEGLCELGVPVRIKWPNDLIVNERKFGGVLIETRSDKRIAGIGLNIGRSPDDTALGDDFSLPATHLRREGYDISPLGLWLNLVKQGKSCFERLLAGTSPGDFVNMVSPRIAWVDTKVRVETGTEAVYTATIAGLSKDGGLRLRAGNREHVLYAGRVVPVQ